MPIPECRPDGYLPLGVHPATQEEVVQRFGQVTARRRVLMVFSRKRWEEWIAFFGQTREFDGRLKGLVEVSL